MQLLALPEDGLCVLLQQPSHLVLARAVSVVSLACDAIGIWHQHGSTGTMCLPFPCTLPCSKAEGALVPCARPDTIADGLQVCVLLLPSFALYLRWFCTQRLCNPPVLWMI
jgi:hypothetical protein